MEIPIPYQIKKLWNKWHLRGSILLSLLLQIFLTLFASKRKRAQNRLWSMFIWAAYLLADWVASVAVGLISSNQGNSNDPDGDKGLMAFWAPFLLLHLGGPDSVTSLSLEDNELWIRALLGLILKVLATAYIFFLSLPKNSLWLPTTLVLMAGTIKYSERILALYLASSDHFGASALPKPEPGPEYERVAEVYAAMTSANIPVHFERIPVQQRRYKDYSNRKDRKSSLLRTAHEIFDDFRGLIAGHMFSSQVRERSREFFLKMEASHAFQLVEYELSFFYDVLHTKVAVVRSRRGCLFRPINLCAVVVALLFFVFIEKHKPHSLDEMLTYVLLMGAIILDTVSLAKLVFSDWTVVSLKNSWGELIAHFVLRSTRRWSATLPQCNFISQCLRNRSTNSIIHEKLLDLLGMGSLEPVTELSSLKHAIFQEFMHRASEADDAKEAGEMFSWGTDEHVLKNFGNDHLLQSIEEFQFSESVLLWHISSELCYWDDNKEPVDNHQKICKILSDYMYFLLLRQPTITGPVAGNWKLVWQDTDAEAKRFFKKQKSLNHDSEACSHLLHVDTTFRSADVKEGISKSVLFDACRLAKELRRLEQAERWKLMCSVWLEFLAYTAINCKPHVHAEQLSKGGEFITVLWLLITHLGFGKQFYQESPSGYVKIVNPK